MHSSSRTGPKWTPEATAIQDYPALDTRLCQHRTSRKDPNGHREPPLSGIIWHWTPGCVSTGLPGRDPGGLRFHAREQATGHQRAYMGPVRSAIPWPEHAAVPQNCSLVSGAPRDQISGQIRMRVMDTLWGRLSGTAREWSTTRSSSSELHPGIRATLWTADVLKGEGKGPSYLRHRTGAGQHSHHRLCSADRRRTWWVHRPDDWPPPPFPPTATATMS